MYWKGQKDYQNEFFNERKINIEKPRLNESEYIFYYMFTIVYLNSCLDWITNPPECPVSIITISARHARCRQDTNNTPATRQ